MPHVRATLSPSGVGGERVASRSAGVRRVGIAAAVAISLACVAVPVVRGGSPEIFVPIFLCFSAAYLVAGAIGWGVRPRNPTGPLLLAIGVSGALILLGAAPISWIGTVTQLSATTATVLLFLVLLISPGGRFSSHIDLAGFVAIAVTYVAIVLVRPLQGAAVPVTLALMSATLLLLTARRWLVASEPVRRSLGPIAGAGVVAASIFLLNSVSGLFGVPNEPGTAVFALDAAGRAIIPFAFLAGLLRLRMARIAVADLMTEFGRLPAPERLGSALAGALRDPTLEVGYWSEAGHRYVAADGSVVRLPGEGEPRAATRLEHSGAPLAVIVHDPALEEDPGLVSAVSAALRLTVENEHLTAEVERQLVEVRASRARIVEAGDAERKRVERDLHDGAQQRLVSLMLALRLTRVRLGSDVEPPVLEALEQAAGDARAALAELRALARGMHPAILTEAGLAAAVQSLADRSSVPISVEPGPEERFARPVEGAAYFVVSEAVANLNKHAAATSATVRISRAAGELRVEIADDGVGNADPHRGSGLTGLADRLAAISGTLDVDSPPGGGTRLTAHIPIAGARGVAGIAL
jgi:signal transduction histidine kinase